ncbi:HAD family hydrolase [Nonomuraea sp. NPDC046802]|uniref:HAD family hydrolase n=1 Tax=Nonomuraea sp. NPDC046802 TaxID=3154919 RepID=UPI0033CBDDB3
MIPPIALILNALLRGHALEALPFAVAVAVGLTPEMLPVVVTTAPARGSAQLARASVIVKRLPAPHDLGAADVLCLDKTGTLCDRVVDGSFAPDGRRDPEVLRRAAMNAFWTLHLSDPPVPDVLDEAVLAVALRRDDEPAPVLAGYVTLVDELAPDAAGALSELSRHGVATKVLTGDHPATAARVCRDLGLPVEQVVDASLLTDAELAEATERATVFARRTPEHKARVVRALREAGHTVGFLGDGVNDLLAMVAADVGVCPRDAVDITREAADVAVIMLLRLATPVPCPLWLATGALATVAVLLPLSPAADVLGLTVLPPASHLLLFAVVLAYGVTLAVATRRIVRRAADTPSPRLYSCAMEQPYGGDGTDMRAGEHQRLVALGMWALVCLLGVGEWMMNG